MTDKLACPGLRGIHAATVCPMDSEGTILEHELAEHISTVASTTGIRGLLVNGHAGEGAMLNREERITVLEIARQSAGTSCHICAGVAAESTQAAVLVAHDAAAAGADSILVFPPNAWALGHDTAMAVTHHSHIADSCALPMLLYRAPLNAAKMSYSVDTLIALIDLDAVVAIKEGSWEVSAYEEAKLAVQTVRPDVAVLGSGDEHLLACYTIGSEGSQVSLAAIVPTLIVALFEAVQAEDLPRARELHSIVYPLSVAIYRQQPGYQATPRLKTCLKKLGRISDDFVREPFLRSSGEDSAMLGELLHKIHT